MSSIKKVILGLFLLLFITGCMKVIEIEGNKEISINESHTYKAIIVSTKFSDMDSYKWKVVSDNKDYTLTGETTSEVTFNASSAGTYTLKVIAKKSKKPFKATIEINVTEPEIINGHVLPPEPDTLVNNSTLLGIDTNNNGVRDDVERKIYFQYKRPIEQAFMMQYAVRYPKVLEDPVGAAASEELQKEMWNQYSCEGYLDEQNGIVMPNNIVDFMEVAYFNTKERMRAYLEFNQAMSGGSYSMPIHDEDLKVENCNFNIDELLEMEK
ncbi:hypothetical protein [Sulfurimonas sp.]|uniref:PKD domain-containing protein n=1 Tax=Sulfurimonas sp. TaxID=2022749 RepID=UPI0025CEF727|nr:hypothetical protein [Sulfurimonas sp.]